MFNDKVSKLDTFYRLVAKRTMPEKYMIPGDLLKIASNYDQKDITPWSTVTTQLTPTTSGDSEDNQLENSIDIPVQWRFRCVMHRSLMNHYVRNLTNLVARVGMYAGLSVLLGCLFWKVNRTTEGQSLPLDDARAVLGAGLFMTQVAYLLPFAQVSTFFFDKGVFAAENPMGLYPPWMYSLTQFFLETWLVILCALVQACISIPMMSLFNPSMPTWSSFFTLFTSFALSGMVGNSLILFHSMALWSQDLTFLAGSGVVIMFLSCSGGFVPLPSMDKWIKWLHWISPIKYSLQAFASTLFGGTDTDTLLVALELDAPVSVGANLGILLGYSFVLSIGTMIALARQKEVR